MKNYGGLLKNPIFRGRSKKNQFRFYVMLGKKERGGDVFQGRLIPQCTP